jgi:predicted metalloendopeptidase
LQSGAEKRRRFDPEGRLVQWWTAEDVRRFRERTQRLVAQYDSYEPLPGLNIQVNRVAFREAELRRAIISGVHSPSKYRTWSVRNHDAW